MASLRDLGASIDGSGFDEGWIEVGLYGVYIKTGSSKAFCISLLYAEPFVYLIKLSKHRPPTDYLLLLEILKLSATVLAWQAEDLVDRNLKLRTK